MGRPKGSKNKDNDYSGGFSRPVVSTPADLPDMLKSIPTALFVNMVSKAGLPYAQSRALCLAFKALKD